MCCYFFLATKALLSESNRLLFLFDSGNEVADFIVLLQLGIVSAVDSYLELRTKKKKTGTEDAQCRLVDLFLEIFVLNGS